MAAVLLTGATGFVGGHLRAALKGSPVVLLGRKRPELLPDEQWSYLDLAEPVAPEKVARGEVLCHLAYSMPAGHKNVDYNRRLLEAVNACPNIRQVVLLSSVSVYGASTSSIVDEDSPCNPVGEYATSKLACELVWREGLRENYIFSGKPPLPGPAMPRWVLRVLGKVTGRPLVAVQVFSSQKIREAGFEDAVFLSEKVRRVARSIEEFV